jgi:hypothetical protein
MERAPPGAATQRKKTVTTKLNASLEAPTLTAICMMAGVAREDECDGQEAVQDPAAREERP